MSTRRIYEKPTFTEIVEPLEREKIVKEILKIRPPVEVSVEGHTELARGRMTEWNDARKFFTIAWEKKSLQFDEVTNAQAGLRAFFKAQLFSSQLVFKTTTVRRLADGSYHYRIPNQIFKQQRRGALRVPIHSQTVTLSCDQGRFKIVDLSVGGARVATKKVKELNELTGCHLNLQGLLLSTEDFTARVTFRGENELGFRFAGLNEKVQTQIKQFLIEALRVHYEQEW